MNVVRAAKNFELVFNFWNINFQTIFWHIIKHEVNYLFTRALLMPGAHCRVWQSGCDLSPALTWRSGRRAPAPSTAPQAGVGAVLNGPPAEARPSGQELQASSSRLFLSYPPRQQEWTCRNRQFHPTWVGFGPYLLRQLVVKLEMHPINWKYRVSTRILVFTCF